MKFEVLTLNKVSISKINKIPKKPIEIDINLENVNLSSFVKKCDKIKVNIGPTPIRIPAVEDCICCSDQLIK